MNIKTKANRVGNTSLAALGERIISTIVKSGIDEAQRSKKFVVLQEVTRLISMLYATLQFIPQLREGDNSTYTFQTSC
ncbi:MAG: hypothetical protein WCK78_04860 [Paludibacter sp.]